MKRFCMLLPILALSACGASVIKDRIVTEQVPVATRPIKVEQVPVVPSPLPPRPSSLSAAADVLLSQVCKLEGYVLQADPLLRSAAGMAPTTLPSYPECERAKP